MLATFSDLPISIQANSNVSPCDLWIVIAHERLRGNCCLSWTALSMKAEAVIGDIGTQCGVFSHMDGPVY